jgi:4-hydroxybenzoyl-CoA thioesterase
MRCREHARVARRPSFLCQYNCFAQAGVRAVRAAQQRFEGTAQVKFTTRKMIQFHHCDPAGIVFYPQYFVILSESKEEFLTHIGHPMHRMINQQRRGWPMVRLETDFKRRSRYGDQVEIDIELFKIGGSSLGVQYTLRGDDGDRLFVRSIIVLTDLDSGQSVPIADDMRAALTPYLIAT